MRIAIVADGLEPLLHDSAVGLADRGHDVLVVVAMPGDGIDPEAAFRLGSRLRVLTRGPEGSERSLANRSVTAGRTAASLARSVTAGRHAPAELVRRLRAQGRSWNELAQMVSRVAPIIAHDADVVYIEAAYVAAEILPVLDLLAPVMIMCTGSDVRVLPHTVPRLGQVMPAVFAQASKVCCRSEELRFWAERCGASATRTEVLLSGVNDAIFCPSPRPARGDGVLRLLSVGRLHWVKGFDRAVEAVALARDRGVDLTYTIVGVDSGAGEAIDLAIRDLGLEEIVRRVGQATQPEIAAAMARADVLLVSSVSEGISRAATEAMTMGLPVITTDVGGMAELVTDGVDGLVVAPRDTAALADAIVAMAGDEQREGCAAAALARSEAFTADAHLDRLERALVETAAVRTTDG